MTGISDDQVMAAFERWKNLEDEKARISDDLKELFSEQKAFGHDTKAMRAAFRLKVKLDEASPEDAEHEAKVDLYLAALNAPRASRAYARENVEEFDAETGEVFDTRSTRKAAEAVSERTEINQPETATKSGVGPLPGDAGALGTHDPAKDEHDAEKEDCSSTTHSRSDDDAFAAVKGKARLANVADVEPSSSAPIAPASHGEAEATAGQTSGPTEGGDHAQPNDPVTLERRRSIFNENLDEHFSTEDSNEVAHDHSHAATAGTRINHIVPATPPKTARDFRPHCLKPDACGASGLSHCYSCRRAMENQEEMA